MRLFGRFALLATTVVVVGTGAAALVVRQAVETPAVEAERERVRHGLDLASALVEGGFSGPGVPPSDVALELGRLLAMRVTLIAPDGRVLGDSGVPDGDIRGMENHGDRPEMRAALDGRDAVLERRSATRGELLVYGARPVLLDGAPAVLRLAAPVAAARAPFAGIATTLLGFGTAGLLALLVGARLLSADLRRGIEDLEGGVRAVGDGDFSRLPDPTGVPADLEALARGVRSTADEIRSLVRELERERDELAGFVESIAEGVVALTEDARILRMNRAAAALLDVPAPAPYAPIGSLVRQPELRDHLEASVLRPLAPREFNVGSRTVLVSAEPLTLGGSVVTLLDLTELRRVERIRRDFVANASHELKTPLTTMRGYAETLLEGDPPEGVRRRFLEAIQASSVRLQNLIDDLLDLSRLEAGRWTVVEEEVDVAATARDAWEEVREAHSARVLDFAVEGEALAVADGRALHQIFRNLLDNALRFTPDGGRVGVRITPSGDRVAVAVVDTGKGIPSDALGRVFERFYRVDPGRDRATGGTGLGLAIVRHLVQSMGGEVRAESRLGEGATIRFTLRRVEAG